MHQIQNNSQSRTDSPRERMIAVGAKNLSDYELLAILLQTGGKGNPALTFAQRLLLKYDGFIGLLKADFHQLIAENDLGPAKVCVIKAACEIGLRIGMNPVYEGKTVKHPEDLYSIVRKELYGKEKEHLILVCLDSRLKCYTQELISVGTVNETLIEPREIYRAALAKNASFIALAHNHPSGNSQPSSEDINSTNRISQAGRVIGIPLIDHLITTDKEYSSLKALDLLGKFEKKGGE